MIDRIAQRLVLQPPEAQRAKGIAASLAVRRFREGLTTRSGFFFELNALGYSPQEAARYFLQAVLEYETDYAMDLLDTYRELYKKDAFSEAQFREALELLGMVPERIDGWVFRETIRKLPTPKAPKEIPARPVSVGLTVEVAPEFGVVEIKVKPVSVGLTVEVAPESLTPAAGPRPTSLGLSVEMAPAVLVEASRPRPSALGLTVEIPREFAPVALIPKAVSLGLTLTVPPGAALALPGPRPVSLGLTLSVSPVNIVEPPRIRPASVGLVLRIEPEFVI